MVYDTTVVRLENVEADDLSKLVRTAGRPVRVVGSSAAPTLFEEG